MRLFKWRKDGGPLSKSWGLFLIEAKRAFSIVLLRFSDGARDAYHTHAFNAYSWVLRGKLIEETLRSDGAKADTRVYTPSFRPIVTPRSCFHKVTSVGTTWAITFRGPWADVWNEFLPDENRFITLTHGRQVLD